MKRFICYLVILISLFLNSCTTENPVSSEIQKGGITLNIDRAHKPANVVEITAYLTREGYEQISGTLNLLSDTTADITFNDIAAGNWHLKVDAADEDSAVVYSGEKDVEILAGITTQVYLTLVPTGAGEGNIYIYVTWGIPQNADWIDFPGNPIVVKFNNNYDMHGVGQCYVLKDETNFKMWYTGLSSNGVGYGYYAYSNDGLSWNRFNEMPVLFPGPNGWDSYHLSPGPVIKEDGIYKMYYSGWQYPDGPSSVGLATSADGINWTKYSNNPVLSGEDWDFRISAQSIIHKDGLYYMFYTGCPFNYNGIYYLIGVATSTDGYIWQKYSGNPIMLNTEVWEGTGVAFPSVIYDNNKFVMVYEGIAQENSAFGLAFSEDGYNWNKDLNNPFFSKEVCKKNWVKIIYPTFIKINNESMLYYTGKDQINSDISICVATKYN